MRELELNSIPWNKETAKIKLYDQFNLYPKIQVIIDKVDDTKYDPNSSQVRLFSEAYDVTSCSCDIKYKTVLYGSCGQMTWRMIHPDCQSLFKEGDRVRLYLDGKCRFCGFIFTRSFKQQGDMNVVAFDYLRYFKSPLIYNKNMLASQDGKTGLTASEIFQKLCQDLKLPFELQYTSSIPVPPKRYDRSSAFSIMEDAINQTIINSPDETKEYLCYFHESNIDEETLKQNSGVVQLHLRNNLTTDCPITDSDLLVDYNCETSIDKQTYNRVILYKNEKSYLGKNGKTLKTGKTIGQIVRIAPSSPENYKTTSEGKYGFLPYYHQCPDSYSEGQMDNVAKQLLDILDRPTASLNLTCYGILGMRAGYLVPVLIKNIAGSYIGTYTTDKNTGEQIMLPVYRTVKECEMIVEHPLKMNIVLSAGAGQEYDL